MTSQPLPVVVGTGSNGLRLVQCRYESGEVCVSCGPDRERYLDWLARTGIGTRIDPALINDKHLRDDLMQAVPAPSARRDSPIERWFWEAHERLKLPELDGLVTQHRVSADGRNYTLDFALVEQRIAFELDGYAWHSDRAAWAKDRRRDLALAVLGWRTYRFDGSLVRADAEAVVRMAAEIVRQATR